MIADIMKLLAVHLKSSPSSNRYFLDMTFGYGGYTQAILNANPINRVVCLDRDPVAIRRAQQLQADLYHDRLFPIQGKFSQLKSILPSNLRGQSFDAVLMDLGVSSMQLDDPARGFSYQSNGPLDMRMSFGGNKESGPSAADLLNTLPQYELERIIREYGEEPFARSIAAAIVNRRQVKALRTTNDLVEIVNAVIKGRRKGKSAAALTFQALRIAVNDEASILLYVIIHKSLFS